MFTFSSWRILSTFSVQEISKSWVWFKIFCKLSSRSFFSFSSFKLLVVKIWLVCSVSFEKETQIVIYWFSFISNGFRFLTYNTILTGFVFSNGTRIVNMVRCSQRIVLLLDINIQFFWNFLGLRNFWRGLRNFWRRLRNFWRRLRL